MQSVMRAIITAQSTQHRHDSTGTTQTRRQLVVQEDVIMNNSRYGVFSEALTAHAAHQHDDKLQAIADYLNTSVATAEGRLAGLLQESLSATRFQFEATINEHMDRRTKELEVRLQERLQVAQRELEAATRSAFDQQSINVGTQISSSIAQAEATFSDHIIELHDDCERRLQKSLGQCERLAERSAKVQTKQQTANIEERLQKLLNGEFNNHKTAFEVQIEARFKDLTTTDIQDRTSVLVDVQGEAIERRLQSKLDSALAASRADVQEYVTIYMNDVSTQLSQDIESAKSEIKAQQNAQATRLEILLTSTNAMNHTAVAAIQTKFQDADLQTREYYQDINLRLDKMNYELEQKIKSASEISEDQWVKITALIAGKLSSNRGVSGSQDVQTSRHISTLDCVREAGRPSKTDDVLITPVDDQLVQQDSAVDILAALREISKYVGNLKDNCELPERNTLVKKHQPNVKQNAKQSSSNATTVQYGIKKTPKIQAALTPAKKTSETKSSPTIPKMSSALAKARGEAIKAMHARTEARLSTMTCTKNVRSKESKKSKK